MKTLMAVTCEVGKEKKLIGRKTHEILFENSLDALEAQKIFGLNEINIPWPLIGEEQNFEDSVEDLCRKTPTIIPHIKLDTGEYTQKGKKFELKEGEKYICNLVRFHPENQFLVMMPLIKIS